MHQREGSTGKRFAEREEENRVPKLVDAVLATTLCTLNVDRPDLLPEATAAMISHRTRYLEELVRCRHLWEEAWAKNPECRDLVFPSRAGTPLDHGNANRQQFKKLLRRAGLPPMRPDDIRHSFATL